MWTRDGLKPIEINSHRLYDLLKTRVGKKSAKAMAYSKRQTANWKKGTLNLVLHGSKNLTDIRLLYLFGCKLTAQQEVILQNNKQKFKVSHEPQPKPTKTITKTIADPELIISHPDIETNWEHWPFIYAHGELENTQYKHLQDFCQSKSSVGATDLVTANKPLESYEVKTNETLQIRCIAYQQPALCVLHRFQNGPTDTILKGRIVLLADAPGLVHAVQPKEWR